jgi:hypothetical protein
MRRTAPAAMISPEVSAKTLTASKSLFCAQHVAAVWFTNCYKAPRCAQTQAMYSTSTRPRT